MRGQIQEDASERMEPFGVIAKLTAELPFSFVFDGRSSRELLVGWRRDRQDGALCWTDPLTALRVRCEMKTFLDFPAAEWLVRFENTGDSDTPVIEDVRALDLSFKAPLAGPPYYLHRTNGAAGGSISRQSCEGTCTRTAITGSTTKWTRHKSGA